MQVRFWGTRGSIATSGKDKLKYGGNTSCVEVRSQSGTLIVIDCGTGVHPLGQQLVKEFNGQVSGHMLISHTHWDHIQGFPFFTPYFVPGNEWHIYGPSGFGPTMNQALSDQMQYTYFPVSMEYMAAKLHFHDLVEGSFRIGDITVRARYLNHPQLTLGYRLEADGASVVYSCDHEPHSHACAMGHGNITGNDHEHAEFLAEADLVIHDSQYTADEYETKMGWGHSTYEYAYRMAQYADVKKLMFTHHDPLRTDKQIDAIVKSVHKRVGGKNKIKAEAATQGTMIGIKGNSQTNKIQPVSVKPVRDSEVDAFSRPLTALMTHAVLLNFGTPAEVKTVTDILKTDSIKMIIAKTADEIKEAIAAQPVSLFVADMDLELFDLDDVVGAIRNRVDTGGSAVPVIAISSEENCTETQPEELRDWIIKPFSIEYLRTRIRAALLQQAGKWVRAPLIKGEEARLAEIQRFGFMSKRNEERYDRITRLVSSYFDAPICLITAVDLETQVFMSKTGTAVEQTSRDQSFCAHAILKREVMIVPDTLQDERFAENPMVLSEPKVRFYAGVPVCMPSGHAIGTLCILDTQPRELSEKQINDLRDFAAMVEHELAREKVSLL
ncbi:GAF domain-containing protein [Parvularcula sp. IMCC14364]|uniref:GAF domain-containing protein n=1 Tax=Parvularcula sp. IMCC14364 TaxID=3067902 RepID=UPI0027415249|nr:GAF domain-containing protein [Parvularcula sp. IMCC14364]